MILRKLYSYEIANAAGCSERAVRRIQSRLERFGATASRLDSGRTPPEGHRQDFPPPESWRAPPTPGRP